MNTRPPGTLDNHYLQLMSAFETLLADTRISYPRRIAGGYPAVFEGRRQDPLYQHIQSCIVNQDELTIPEYIYYALITDDVSQLNPKKLAHCHETEIRANVQNKPELWNAWKVIQPFTDNIQILISALEYSHKGRPENIVGLSYDQLGQLHEKLCSQLCQKLNARTKKPFSLTAPCLFLNLRHIKLFKVHFKNIEIIHCDLTGADLNEAVLRKTTLSFVCLNDASFSCARLDNTCISDSLLNKINFRASSFADSQLVRSRVCHANFTSVQTIHAWFDWCTFDGSSFNGASLDVFKFRNCRLNRCTFQNTYLYNLSYTDFPTAFTDTDFRGLDWEYKYYLPWLNQLMTPLIHTVEWFTSTTKLNELLNELHSIVYSYSELLSNPCDRTKAKANTAAAAHAKNLLAHINFYSDNPYIDRATLLQEALKHPLFYDYVSHSSVANVINGNIATFFRPLKLNQPTAAQSIIIEAINDPDIKCTALTALTKF